jgi:hypothetical protein
MRTCIQPTTHSCTPAPPHSPRRYSIATTSIGSLLLLILLSLDPRSLAYTPPFITLRQKQQNLQLQQQMMSATAPHTFIPHPHLMSTTTPLPTTTPPASPMPPAHNNQTSVPSTPPPLAHSSFHSSVKKGPPLPSHRPETTTVGAPTATTLKSPQQGATHFHKTKKKHGEKS